MFAIPRLSWDHHWMLEAAVAATRSTCDRGPELLLNPRRHGVGSVIVRDNRIIAGGYNGSPPGEPHCDEMRCPKCGFKPIGAVEKCPSCDSNMVGGHLIVDNHCVRTLHAEENALLQCAMDGVSPVGATIYTTASPCWDCAKRIVRVKIVRVVYGALYDSRYKLSADAINLFSRAGIICDYLMLDRSQLEFNAR